MALFSYSFKTLVLSAQARAEALALEKRLREEQEDQEAERALLHSQGGGSRGGGSRGGGAEGGASTPPAPSSRRGFNAAEGVGASDASVSSAGDLGGEWPAGMGMIDGARAGKGRRRRRAHSIAAPERANAHLELWKRHHTLVHGLAKNPIVNWELDQTMIKRFSHSHAHRSGARSARRGRDVEEAVRFGDQTPASRLTYS